MTTGERSPFVARLARSVPVGFVGLVVAIAIAWQILGVFDGDPSGFVRFGEDWIPYATDQLGEVSVSPGDGHDGKFFFMLARDPLFLDPSEHAAQLDDAVYRGRRILYPLIAGGVGLVPAGALVWTMLAVNVFALGLGTFVTAGLAQAMGRSRWFGLAFVLNPGMLFELAIDGSSVLGWGLAVAAVWMLEEGRAGTAVVLFSLAGLARETMLIVALGAAVAVFVRGAKKTAGVLIGVPVAVFGLWSVYATWRLRGLPADPPSVWNSPFSGLNEALPEWFDAFDLDGLLGLLVGLSIIIVLIAAVRRPSPLAWGVVGFALLPMLLSTAVLGEFFDITRVIAPVLTSAPLLAIGPVSGLRLGEGRLGADGLGPEGQ